MRSARQGNVFRWEGEYWTIVYERQTVRLRDSKGMRYLAALLRRPGEPISAVELHVAARRDPSRRPAITPSAEQARLAVTKGIKSVLERIANANPALADHLTATVRRGYVCRYLPDPRHPIAWKE